MGGCEGVWKGGADITSAKFDLELIVVLTIMGLETICDLKSFASSMLRVGQQYYQIIRLQRM